MLDLMLGLHLFSQFTSLNPLAPRGEYKFKLFDRTKAEPILLVSCYHHSLMCGDSKLLSVKVLAI